MPSTIKKDCLRTYAVGLLIFLTVMSVFFTGCTDSGGNSVKKNLRIGIVISPQGLNDKGFNEMAHTGMKNAEKLYGAETIIIEPVTMHDSEASLRFFTGQTFDAIIAVGMSFIEPIKKVSKEHPELPFFIIDSDISEGKIRGISFREEEGSFLCGYLASSMSKSNKIGFVGGVNIPVIQRFLTGYKEGAAFFSSDTQVIEKFVAEGYSGFNLADKAKQITLDMYQGGCDVIFHAAGASGLGVISAGVEAKKFLIGADMNQDWLAPGLILTSMVKRVDLVVENIIKSLHDGNKLDTMKFSYGISDGGLDLTDFEFTRNIVGDELIAKLNTLKNEISSGKRKVSVPVK
ncbi:MAG: BMP family ABC transporter substrate-binding protein [Candidatus Riflebacteria bacterium]|nr:BMP family ABC transporter substrate-binding protein [Candidatus Riflebacteria bacterium]